MWSSQFNRLSLARITASSVGSRVSSPIVRSVIPDRIPDTAPLSSRRICAVNFHYSHPYRRVDMTDAFRKRRRRPFGSLEAVRSRLSRRIWTRRSQSDDRRQIRHYCIEFYLLTLLHLPLIEVANAMTAYCYSTASYPQTFLVAFSILRFGTSAKSVL